MSDYAGADTFHTTVTVLDDSDDPSAANFALPVEGLADRTVWLKSRGAYSDYAEATSSAIAGGGSDVVGPVDSAGNWQDFASGSGVTPSVLVADCEVGDRIEVYFRGDLVSEGASNVGSFRLAYQINAGSTVGIDATEVVSVWDYATIAFPMPVAVSTVIAVASAGSYTIKMQGKNSDPGKIGVLTQHRCYLRAVRHRPTA